MRFWWHKKSLLADVIFGVKMHWSPRHILMGQKQVAENVPSPQWTLLRPNLVLTSSCLQTGLSACWLPFKIRSSLLIAWADLYLESWNVLVSGGARKMPELISKSIWADPTRTPSSKGCWSRSFWRLDLKELSGFPETGKRSLFLSAKMYSRKISWSASGQLWESLTPGQGSRLAWFCLGVLPWVTSWLMTATKTVDG